ncbi:hypothetical protein A2Z22_01460 [Candidatus Woesebacteria bacterium RBG_16_34_12]|uniref:Response regulatory domain-containing protein n=1 Tax=Candidatus Woesebacteria bacterium RBG_16_34_12 TaxID=1802480 RepID=A0A1F7XA54_9BACT|nr:MAG: hypothetical protein A2Z22_01460 [Candidatus Woesebacteria bacterium RBG_16_34_12]
MAKILIVEDDSVLSHLYQNAFSFQGFEVEMASDGKEGLEAASSLKPDLILTDIMMPNMDGIEMLKKIKAKPQTKNIPVIVMSNLSNEEDVQTALAEGALKHINKKEFGPKEVVGVVKNVLSGNKVGNSSDISEESNKVTS